MSAETLSDSTLSAETLVMVAGALLSLAFSYIPGLQPKYDALPATTKRLVMLGLLVLVGVGVKLYDLKRKREAEGVHLQAQVSDALLRDPGLFGLAVTPTAHVPWWSGTPAHLEVVGRVPTAETRDRVVRLVEEEARQLRSDVEIVDRLQIDPAAGIRVA